MAHRALRSPQESGVALVVLLVVVLAVAVVGMAMASNVIREAQIAVNESNAIQARYLAEAGIAAAAAQLVNNTYAGPLTQPLGVGSYTVQVTTVNSAVKRIVSTGQVFYQGTTPTTVSAAQQTIQATVLVLPQAFAKALLSNTVVTVFTAGTGSTPTVQNTVLRQLGAIHANNLNAEDPAVTVLGVGTTVINQVTTTQMTINIDPAVTCIACAPDATQPTIPFPTFNWASYQTRAQAAGTFFTSQGTFDAYVAARPTDPQGFRTLSGIVFVQAPILILPRTPAERKLKILGTLVVYQTSGFAINGLRFIACSVATPCGDLVLNGLAFPLGLNNLVFTGQNGDPAIMTGGGVLSLGFPGPLSITGLVYLLANTADPTQNPPSEPGYLVLGAPTAPVTIRGAVVGQRVNAFDSDSLVYDPSVFFPGLPSGLNATGGPSVLLPLSWSSAK